MPKTNHQTTKRPNHQTKFARWAAVAAVAAGMWAGSAGVAKAYDWAGIFIVDTSGWDTTTYSHVQWWVGHGNWTAYSDMTAIANTHLYYYTQSSTWAGASYMGFAADDHNWGSWEGDNSSNYKNAPHYTKYYNGSYGLNAGSHYFFARSSSANDATITPTYYSAYGSLNLSGTVGVKVKTYGGSTYSAPSTSPAKVTASGYKLTSWTAAGASTATLTAGGSTVSTTHTTVLGNTVTYAVSSVASGYTFDGWYNASGTRLSTSTSYTSGNYTATPPAIYAHFTQAVAPTAGTPTAASITTSGAEVTLGTINMGGAASTAVTFQYGTSTSYGTSATPSPTSFTAATTSGSTTATLSSLAPGTTYYYKWTISNAAGSVTKTGSFTTKPNAPTITIGANTATYVRFTPNANGNGAATTYKYTVATTDSGTPDTTCTAGTQVQKTGMTKGTKYYVRVMATAGGNDSTVASAETATKPGAPTVTVTSYTANSVTFTIGANGNGSATTYKYIVSTGNSTTPNTVCTAGESVTVSGLSSGTTYYVRARGTTSDYAGGSDGDIASASFTTATGVVAPTIAEGTKSVGTTTASLPITVNMGGGATTAAITLKYGTASGSYGSSATVSPTTLGADVTAGAVSGSMSGLSANTTYYYQWTVKNSAGTTTAEGSFTTASEIALSATSWTYAGSNPAATISGGGGSGAYSVTLNSTSPTGAGTVSVSGTTLTLSPSKAGTFNITITRAANGIYAAQSKSFALTLNKGTQGDLGVSLSTTTYAGSAITLTGSGGKAGAYSFSVPSEWGSVSGTSLTLVKAGGSIPITVTRAGDDLWNSKSTTVNKTVNKGTQTVTLNKSSATIAVGGTTTLTATRSPSAANGTITWTSSDTSKATVSGGTVTGVAEAASVTISAKAEGNDLWNASATASCTVKVLAAEPTGRPTIEIASRTATTMTISVKTMGNNSAYTLIEMNTGGNESSYFAAPSDGTSYSANRVYTSAPQLDSKARIVMVGDGTSVEVTGLTAGTQYFIRAYAYNGSGTTVNYYTTQYGSASGYTLPNTPTLAAAADGKTMVRLTMTKPSGAMTGLVLLDGGSATPSTAPGNVGGTLGGGKILWKGNANGTLEHVVASGSTHTYRLYSYVSTTYSEVSSQTVTMGSFGAEEIVDTFSYTNGVSLNGLNGEHGWSGAWDTGGTTAPTIVSQSGSNIPVFPNYTSYPNNTGNRIKTDLSGNTYQTEATRDFAAVSGGSVYAAAILSYQWQGGKKWAQIGLGNGSGVGIKAGHIWSDGEDYHLGIDAYDQKTRSGSFEINPFQWDDDNDYLVVLKYDFSTGMVSVKGYYHGATVPTDEPGSWDVTYTVPSGSRPASLSRFGLLAGATEGAVGDVYFDEVRVATSWEALLGQAVLTPENIAVLSAASAGKELVRVTATAPANAKQIVVIAKSGGDLTTLTSAEQALKSGAPGATAGNAKVIAVANATAGNSCTVDHVVAPGSEHGYFAYAKNSTEYSPNYTAATGSPVATGTYDSGEYLDTMSYTNGVAASGSTWTGGQGWGAAWSVVAGTWKPVRPSEVVSTVDIAGTIGNATEAGNALKLSNPGEGGSGCLERQTGGDAWGGQYNNAFYVAFRMAYSWQGNNRWAGLKLIDTTSGSQGVFIGRTTADADGNLSHTRLGIEAATSSGGTPSVGSGASGTLNALSETGGAENAYLVVARVKWTAAGYADIDAKAYAVGATLEATEPTSWHAHWGGAYLANVRSIQLQAGSLYTEQIGDVYFDEVRFGDSWDDLLGGVPPQYVWMDGQTTTAYLGDWVTNAVRSRPVGERQGAKSALLAGASPTAAAFEAAATEATYAGKEESDTVTVWHGRHQIESVATTPLYGFGAVSGGGTTMYSMDHTDAAYTKHTYELSALTAPAAFSATAAGATKVNLTWTPYSAGGRTFDEVLVVRLSSSAAASVANLKPAQGTTYSVGQTFAFSTHTATVIYRGTGTEFADTRLSASTRYDYAIFTANNGYYSTLGGSPAGRRTANATTAAGSAAMPEIDGDGSDWEGTAAATWNSADVSDGEFVWNDKKGDLRKNSDACLAGDLDEFRVKADDTWVYFLVRLGRQAAAAAGKTIDLQDAYVAVGVDTRLDAGSTAMNWLGDESATTFGDGYHGTAAERYASRQMAVHWVGGSENTWQVEMYAEDGAKWYAPPTEGWSVAAAGAATDPCIEWRVARADLGLTAAGSAVTTGRFSVATFANAKGWNQDTKATVDIGEGTSAAVDAMEFVPYGVNDAGADLGAWDEGLVDKKVNFWADVGFDAAGVAANRLPTEPAFSGATSGHGSPTLEWTQSSDQDAKGFVTGYLFELAEDSETLNGLGGGTENGKVLYRINLKGAGNTSYRPKTTGTEFWWRVRARDDSGQLSAGTIRRYGVEGQKDLDGPEPKLLYVGTEVAKFLDNTDGYRDDVEASGDALAVVDEVYSSGTAPTFGFVLEWNDPSGVYATNHSWDSGYTATTRYAARVSQGLGLDGYTPGGGEGAFTWNILGETGDTPPKPFGRVSPNWDLMLVDTTHQYPARPTLQAEGIDWEWNATLELPTVDGGKTTTSGWTFVYDKDLPFLPSQTRWDDATHGTDANAGVPCITNFVSQAFKLPAYDPDVSLYLTVSAEDDNAYGDGNTVPDGWMRGEEWHDDSNPSEGHSHAHYSADTDESSGSCNDGPSYARNITTNRLIHIPVRDDDSEGPVASATRWSAADDGEAFAPSLVVATQAVTQAEARDWTAMHGGNKLLPRLEGTGQGVTYQLTDAMLAGGLPLTFLFNAYDLHTTSGLQLGAAATTAVTTEYGGARLTRTLTNTAFRARSWNATGYAAVESPSGDPSAQGWYEWAGGTYAATADTAVTAGKTYYEPADDGWATSAENTAAYASGKSTLTRRGGSTTGLGTGLDTILAWDFGTVTADSLGALFGVPNLLDYMGHHSDGVTNLVQLHAWDCDNDRDGDQADAEVTFGTLLLTDDDATAPVSPGYALLGSGTNYVEFGALGSWEWTGKTASPADWATNSGLKGISAENMTAWSVGSPSDSSESATWLDSRGTVPDGQDWSAMSMRYMQLAGGMQGATYRTAAGAKYFQFDVSGENGTRWTADTLQFDNRVTGTGPTKYTLTVQEAANVTTLAAVTSDGQKDPVWDVAGGVFEKVGGIPRFTLESTGGSASLASPSFQPNSNGRAMTRVQYRVGRIGEPKAGASLTVGYRIGAGARTVVQTHNSADFAESAAAKYKNYEVVSFELPTDQAGNFTVTWEATGVNGSQGFLLTDVSVVLQDSYNTEHPLVEDLVVEKMTDSSTDANQVTIKNVVMNWAGTENAEGTTWRYRLYAYGANGGGNWGINKVKLLGITMTPRGMDVTDGDLRHHTWENALEVVDGEPTGYDTDKSGLWLTGDKAPTYSLSYPEADTAHSGVFASGAFTLSRIRKAAYAHLADGDFEAAPTTWTLTGATVEEATGTGNHGHVLKLAGGDDTASSARKTFAASLEGMTAAQVSGVTVSGVFETRATVASGSGGANGLAATVRLKDSGGSTLLEKVFPCEPVVGWRRHEIGPWSADSTLVRSVEVEIAQETAGGTEIAVDNVSVQVATWGAETTEFSNGERGAKLSLQTADVPKQDLTLSEKLTGSGSREYVLASTVHDYDRDRTDDALPVTVEKGFELYDDDTQAPSLGAKFGGPVGIRLGNRSGQAYNGSGTSVQIVVTDHQMEEAKRDSQTLAYLDIDGYDQSGWTTTALALGYTEGGAAKSVAYSGADVTEGAAGLPAATNTFHYDLSALWANTFVQDQFAAWTADMAVNATLTDLDDDRNGDDLSLSAQLGTVKFMDNDTTAPAMRTSGSLKGVFVGSNSVVTALNNISNAAWSAKSDYEVRTLTASDTASDRVQLIYDGELRREFYLMANVGDALQSGTGVSISGLQRGNRTTQTVLNGFGDTMVVTNTTMVLSNSATVLTNLATHFDESKSSKSRTTRGGTAAVPQTWYWPDGMETNEVGVLLPAGESSLDFRVLVEAYDADTNRPSDQAHARLEGPVLRVRDDDTTAPEAPAGVWLNGEVVASGEITRDNAPWKQSLSSVTVAWTEAVDPEPAGFGTAGNDIKVAGIAGYRLGAPGTTPGVAEGTDLTGTTTNTTEHKVTKTLTGLAIDQGFGNNQLFAVDKDADRAGDALAGAAANVPLALDFTKPTAVRLKGTGTGASTDEVDDPTTQMDITWVNAASVGPDDPEGDKDNYDKIPDAVKADAKAKGRADTDILSPWLTYKVYYREYDPQEVEAAATGGQSPADVIYNDYIDDDSFGTEAAGWLAVTNDAPISDPSAGKSKYDTLGTVGTSSVRVYDLDFDREYLFVVVGVDKAGNEGPANALSWATNNTIKFAVTQGLIRASADINTAVGALVSGKATNTVGMAKITGTDAPKKGAVLYWMGAGMKDGKGEVKKYYDLIYRDAASFSETGTEQWNMASTADNTGTSKTNWNYQADAGLDTPGRMRFYRASYAGRWQDTKPGTSEKQYPLASEEVYSMNNVVLSEGFNYVSLQGVPWTNTFRGVFGTATGMWPGGKSVADTNSAAVIEFYQPGTSASVREWYFFGADGKWYNSTGTDVTDTLQADGFFAKPFGIVLPKAVTNDAGEVTSGWWLDHADYDGARASASRSVKAMMWHPILQVPTNGPAAGKFTQSVTAAAGTYNTLSLNLPVSVHPKQLGLVKTDSDGTPQPGQMKAGNWVDADKLYVIDSATKEVRGNSTMYCDGQGVWRYNKNSLEVTGTPIHPNDMLVLISAGGNGKNGATVEWVWTYSPTDFYTLPTRHMGR
ncbi:MAG: hypothetical protein IKO01_08205 [Kiritimatiellae bacterium]|nr:hypothetical protein [Kiritimatiellia bacterium]